MIEPRSKKIRKHKVYLGLTPSFVEEDPHIGRNHYTTFKEVTLNVFRHGQNWKEVHLTVWFLHLKKHYFCGKMVVLRSLLTTISTSTQNSILLWQNGCFEVTFDHSYLTPKHYFCGKMVVLRSLLTTFPTSL